MFDSDHAVLMVLADRQGEYEQERVGCLQEFPGPPGSASVSPALATQLPQELRGFAADSGQPQIGNLERCVVLNRFVDIRLRSQVATPSLRWALVTVAASAAAWFWAPLPLSTALPYIHPSNWIDADLVRQLWPEDAESTVELAGDLYGRIGSLRLEFERFEVFRNEVRRATLAPIVPLISATQVSPVFSCSVAQAES